MAALELAMVSQVKAVAMERTVSVAWGGSSGSGNRRPMNAYAGPGLIREMVKAQALPDGVSQKARIVKGGYILTHGI